MNAVLLSKLGSARNFYRMTILVLMFEFHKFRLLQCGTAMSAMRSQINFLVRLRLTWRLK